MIEQSQKPSWVLLYGVLAFLILLAGALFYLFITSSSNLYTDLNSLKPIISFDKGSFYLPGVEIGLGVLLFIIIYEIALGKKLTRKMAKVCTRISVMAVIIIFTLPTVMQYMVENTIDKHHYQECGSASHQWLFAKTLVYANDSVLCQKNSKSKKSESEPDRSPQN